MPKVAKFRKTDIKKKTIKLIKKNRETVEIVGDTLLF